MQRLWNEYEAGVLRFDGEGEALLGIYDESDSPLPDQTDRLPGRMLAIGGIRPDPYLDDPRIGRIQHVYVLNAYRGQGIGRRLLHALIEPAKAHYHTLTLRTMTPDAIAFYNTLGFENTPRYENATHWLTLD